MSRRSFRIGRAKTGLGLFATRPIKKGAFIVRYSGRRIPNAEAERREARGARYMYELNKKYTLDGSGRRNLGRYANHACRPNAESVIFRGQVRIKAMRRIKPGDEITYHYGKDYYDAYIGKARCKCNTCKLRRARERLARKRRAERQKRAAAKLRAAKRKAAGRRKRG
jgi:SET domain-containing protein